MDFESVNDAIQAFEANSTHETAARVVALLSHNIDLLSEKSGDYPDQPITADVFMLSLDLSTAAQKLTALFKADPEFIGYEEEASRLWCSAVLATRSHYHHVVGPAMLARAECNERLEDNKVAGQIYDAVVKDFLWFVDHWIDATAPIDPDDHFSLICLQRALRGAARCGGEKREATLRTVQTLIDRRTE